jgi:flagellin
MLDTVGKILDRMSELKGLASSDPMKSDSDIASYNNEFKDLQSQLHSISQQKFNGVSLYAEHTTKDGDTDVVLSTTADYSSADNTLTVYTSSSGSAGSKVSIHKSALLSALTFDTRTLDPDAHDNAVNTSGDGDETTNFVMTLATASGGNLLDLADISVGVLTQALENVSFLRAQNGGSHSRLAFNAQSLSTQKTNMRGALGRMVDVDIAEETTNLAKFSILNQAAASMLAQANASTDVALMLLR